MRTLVFAAMSGIIMTAAGNVSAACSRLLDLSLNNLQDEPTALCQYHGKVILVVNTASQCGYTPQYAGLERLYKRYKDKGLVVLGFPANDFGQQEPGSNKEIATFCEVNYGVSFPIFARSGVLATNANPLFSRLAERSGKRPQWNFHKYLIDRRGEAVLSFDSAVEPEDPRFVASIERFLAGP